MALDPRQLVLLGIALAVPAVAFVTGRSRMLLAWVAFTLYVQVFDTAIFTNLPAGRLVGLLYLPSAVALFRRWSGVLPARAWLLNFGYMALLGGIFGFLMPWPDVSGARPFGVRAEGRTIIFLVRTLSDLSLAVFVMNQLTQPGAFETLRKWMVRGAAVSTVTAYATLVTGFDFYTAITGLREYAAWDWRPRGLAYEARGFGLACAYGVMLLLGKQTRRPRDWMYLLLIGGGLAVSASASALAAAFFGLLVILFIGSMRARFALIVGGIVILVLVGLIAGFFPDEFELSMYSLRTRAEGRGVLEDNVPANLAEEVALRMDVFDSAASLFLIRNPIYALIGTGPGLISLPASDHIPYGLYRAVFPVIDNPPSHGLLLEIANTGVLGLATWIFQVAAVYFAGRRLRRGRRLPFPPRTATTIFVAGAALYAVQVSPSPFWAVFLGIGWAIAEVSATARMERRMRAAARPPAEAPPFATGATTTV